MGFPRLQAREDVNILTVLRVIVKHHDQRVLVTAFAIGYCSHLIGDALGPVVTRDISSLGYVLWPLTTVPDGGTRSFIEFFLTLDVTPLFIVDLVLTGAGLFLWVSDGLPGVKDLYLEYTREDTYDG